MLWAAADKDGDKSGGRGTDSAAIERADSVAPRRVNQQTFIFLQKEGWKNCEWAEDKGDEEERKTSREEVRPPGVSQRMSTGISGQRRTAE